MIWIFSLRGMLNGMGICVLTIGYLLDEWKMTWISSLKEMVNGMDI